MPASAEAESLSFSRKSGRSHFFDTLKHPAKAWRFFPLNESHFLFRTTARQWEIIRAADLETVQVIPSFFFPSERGTSPWCIRDAWLEDGQLRVNAFRSADNDGIISEDFTVDSGLSTEIQDSV